MFRLYAICFFLSPLFSLCGYGSEDVAKVSVSYKGGHLLGSGAVAAVYYGYEKGRPDRPCALRITPHTLHADLIRADLEGLILQGAIPDHPNILKLLNLKCDPGEDIVSVFPFMSGGDLCRFMLKVGKVKRVVTDELACRCFRSWTKAVVFLHSQGITHRDIKPENILVGFYLDASSPDAIPAVETPHPDSLKLSDFGFAKRFTPGEKQTDFCGTFLYQAPEIYERRHYSETVDVWSATVTFFVLKMQIFPFIVGGADFSVGKISEYSGYQASMSPQMQKFFEFVFSRYRLDPEYITAQRLMDTLDEYCPLPWATFDPPRESPVRLPQRGIAIPSDRQSELLSPASVGLPPANSAKSRVPLLRRYVRKGGRESWL